MKTKITFVIGLILALSLTTVADKSVSADKAAGQQTFSLATTQTLLPMVNDLVAAYRRNNPGTVINIVEISSKPGEKYFGQGAGLAIVGTESLPSGDPASPWTIVIGRDVIVPVMNSANPMMDQIVRKGIRPASFAKMINSGEPLNWDMLLENGSKLSAHFYRVQDAIIDQHISNFTKSAGQTTQGIVTGNGRELVLAVQKDPMSIGFCRLTDLKEMSGDLLAGKVMLVPIDRNGDGRIDFMEDIYGNLNDFSRGVWIGKYPKSLTENIYAIAPGRPDDAGTAAFLDWILSDGQSLMEKNGFSELVNSERQTQLDKLNPTPVLTGKDAQAEDRYATMKKILLIVAGFVLLGILLDFVSKTMRVKKSANEISIPHPSEDFNENSVVVPKGLFYDKSHTWAFLERDGSTRVGIDDFLQHITGPITRIEMKDPGEHVRKGETVATLVQRGKRLNIKSPVTGTIITCNTGLLNDPSPINLNPYTEGWICLVEPANWSLESSYMSAADHYQKKLKEEFVRLKDFFASIMNSGNPAYAAVALQDGGAFRDHILMDFGPEVWEDFETGFLNQK